MSIASLHRAHPASRLPASRLPAAPSRLRRKRLLVGGLVVSLGLVVGVAWVRWELPAIVDGYTVSE